MLLADSTLSLIITSNWPLDEYNRVSLHAICCYDKSMDSVTLSIYVRACMRVCVCVCVSRAYVSISIVCGGGVNMVKCM